MAELYNAREVFDIGIEIEKSGEAFYKAAAEAVEEPKLKSLFSELSDWEAGHVGYFEKLKANLTGPGEGIEEGTEDEYHRYLKAASDCHIFMAGVSAAELAQECEAPIDIISLALNFEKDSVVLFTAMKDVVSKKFGKNEIDFLIKEEIRHISLLNDRFSDMYYGQE
jgi:rubrerythrin